MLDTDPVEATSLAWKLGFQALPFEHIGPQLGGAAQE